MANWLKAERPGRSGSESMTYDEHDFRVKGKI